MQQITFASYRVPIYTPGWRAAMWIKCLAEGQKVPGIDGNRTRNPLIQSQGFNPIYHGTSTSWSFFDNIRTVIRWRSRLKITQMVEQKYSDTCLSFLWHCSVRRWHAPSSVDVGGAGTVSWGSGCPWSCVPWGHRIGASVHRCSCCTPLDWRGWCRWLHCLGNQSDPLN